jgi:Fe-S cluster assembly ATPase SufC
MRIFAGPNGSGKSTLNGVINPALLGIGNPPEKYNDLEVEFSRKA